MRLKTEIIDIVLTIAVGLFRDRVLFDERGLDSINNQDYREWLLRHGCMKSSVNSPFLHGIYDFAFAYSGGRKDMSGLAAGVALRSALRMFFTYRGSLVWRLRSGMGEAVFAPLYRVLQLPVRSVPDGKGASARASPVQFHFLHELDTVSFEVPSRGKRFLSSLKFKTFGDPAMLDDLSSSALDNSGCWPDSPNQKFVEGLKQGAKTRELVLGTDFDRVILAMGVADVERACANAMKITNGGNSTLPSEWRLMCSEVKTVATKSAQVWLGEDLEGQGWHRGSLLMTSLDLSFDTWADMTHVLGTERAYRAGGPDRLDDARSLAYFCAAIPDTRIEHLRKQVRAGPSSLLNTLSDEFRSVDQLASNSISEDLRNRALSVINQVMSDLSDVAPGNNLHDFLKTELHDLANSISQSDTGTFPRETADRLGTVSAKIEHHLLQIALDAQVDRDLTALLAREMQPIWPSCFEAGSTALQFEISRHVQANFEGSDRYTLSLPGSIEHRISPLDRTVQNMTIAGDWTACGLDNGCVEAAVMSGKLAACATSGKPDLRSIIGYDHP
jgi:hypothetical protein